MDFIKLLNVFLRDDALVLTCIYCGCFLVANSLEHRRHFVIRAVIGYLIPALWMFCTARDLLTLLSGGMMLWGMLRYWTLFLLLGLLTPFCSKAGFCQSVYAITVAYSIQNMCERLIEIPRYTIPDFPVALDRFCLFLLMAASLLLYRRLLLGGSRQRSIFDFGNMSSRVMLFLGVGVVGVSVGMDIYMRGELSDASLTLQNGYNVLSALFSFLTVVICMSHLRETDSERRALVSAQLLYSEQRLYEQQRSIHEAINIKCHDIRHQIAAMGDAAYGAELKKIGRLVNIYDTAPHTKNAALDVVLGGKQLYCTNEGITLTCLADGRQLGFMDDADIYALFGNILDNAIEATQQLNDPERQLISLTVGTMGNLLMIDTQNFYTGDIAFDDGLPVTQKADKDYHGFGTRSIRLLTEKYGGDLKMQAEQGVFRLSIMLPIPEA